MMKNHKGVSDLESQIANSGLTMELDVPKSQDLNKIMVRIWAQYDKLAQRTERIYTSTGPKRLKRILQWSPHRLLI